VHPTRPNQDDKGFNVSLHVVALHGRHATIAARLRDRGWSMLNPCEQGLDVVPLP
jgi:hypothetical protein